MKTAMSIAERLKKSGIAPHPPSPPVYKCPACHDVGFVRLDVDIYHPLFGKLQPCTECSGGRLAAYADEFGLLPADRELTWATLINTDKSIVSAKMALQLVLKLGYGWVYIWGNYGTAKTTLLKIAIADCLRSGVSASYTRMSDMLDEIRSAYDHNQPQEESARRLRRWSALKVLAIDEIEKTNETGFVVERRFQILDHRYELATREKAGITLIAGNVKPEALDGALGSRIRDGRFEVVHITAQDARPIIPKVLGNA